MKTILITGASRGIGLATAKKFLDNDWRVIGAYLHHEIPLEHKNLAKIKFAQSLPESIKEAVQKISEITQHIDVLVNNAAIILDNQTTEIDSTVIKETFEVDLFGLIDLTQQLVPLMSTGSHIINIDSGYGAMSVPIDDKTSAGYRMAKAALNMYTRILAFHLKDSGIVVSSLDPGWVATDMGNVVATETEKPDRTPEQAGQDIYKLATSTVASGHFWRYGNKREW